MRTDGPWSGGNITLSAPASVVKADGPWSSGNITLVAPSVTTPKGDGPWAGGNIVLRNPHKPVGVWDGTGWRYVPLDSYDGSIWR